MTKRSITAMEALYGTIPPDPATTVLPCAGTFAKSQKNRLPHLSRKGIEAGIQMKLVAWLRNHAIPHYSIPNEGNRGQLATHKLKQMGLRPGASDLFIQRMRGGYGGYYIELKTPGNKPTPAQVEFMNESRREGYKAEWFDDLGKVQQSVLEYLEGIAPNVKQF